MIQDMYMCSVDNNGLAELNDGATCACSKCGMRVRCSKCPWCRSVFDTRSRNLAYNFVEFSANPETNTLTVSIPYKSGNELDGLEMLESLFADRMARKPGHPSNMQVLCNDHH